jgi:drug/metabolite transporter (DMT)-like permease
MRAPIPERLLDLLRMAAERSAWRRAALLLVLAALFWAGNFVMGRAVRGEVPPVALAFWRWVVAAAVFGWGLYSVLLRRIPPRTFSALGLLTVTVLFGLALLAPSWLAEIALTGATPRRDPLTAAAVLYAALAASIGAYLCWNGGVALIGAAASGPFLHLQPAFGTVLAMLLLGEMPRPFHGAGFALVLAGVALAAGPARR